MQIEISKLPLDQISSDWLIVGLFQSPDAHSGDNKPESAAAQACVAAEDTLNELTNGLVARLREASDFKGKLAEQKVLYQTTPLAVGRIVLLGLGNQADLTWAKLSKAYSTALRSVCENKDQQATVVVPTAIPEGKTLHDLLERLSLLAETAHASQALYKQEVTRFPLTKLSLLVEESVDIDTDEIQHAPQQGLIIGQAMNLVKELVDRGPHDVFPISFADKASSLAAEFGIPCQIFDEQRLSAERMNSMLGVARGSTQPPRMVMLDYQGGNPDEGHIALVGKGVTFDSGGYSLKPTDGMLSMKCDMAGAATVLGTVIAAARLNLPVNIRGYMGLVENMVSGNAYKLGEVLTARNNTTIEVCNTDAEGRLVLADVLCYAVDQGASSLIDLATLTGACVVALGEDYVGLFSNNDELSSHLMQAADREGELLWRMPLDDSFQDQLKSEVADCKNVGTRWGGAITAAKFLEKFVSKKPWAHLDIAGPAYMSTGKPHRDGGATAVMVKTLINLLKG